MSLPGPHARNIAATPSSGIKMGRTTGLGWNSPGKSWYWKGGEPFGPDARLRRGDVRAIPGNAIGERFSNLSG